MCKPQDISPKTQPVLFNRTSTVEQGEGSTVEAYRTSTVKPSSIKENFKENIKETHTQGAEEIFELWKPDLHTVNSWLQRSGEKPMTQQEFDEFKISFLGHYANRIQTGLINDHQLFGKMISWVKGDYSKYRKTNFEKSTKPKVNDRNVNDKWPEVHHKPIADFIVDLPEDWV